MLSLWIYTIASVVVVSLISLIGVFTLAMGRKRLQRILFILVSLAVGAMLGDAFIHLLPESFGRSRNSLEASFYCLAGLISFFVLEKFLLWRHDHAAEHSHPIHPVGYINLIAEGLHNFIDGFLIGASYLVSIPIGLATTIAVLLHEIPQEIGHFGILLHAGFSSSKAIGLNFLTALLSILGAILSLLMGAHLHHFSEGVLPLAAGGFIYIAGSDLVPELHKEREPPQAAVQLLAIGVGIGLMLLLKLLE